MAGTWTLTVASYPQGHSRTRGDWAGMTSHAVPESDLQLFKFQAERQQIREEIARQMAKVPDWDREVERKEEARQRLTKQISILEHQERSLEKDLAIAASHLRYAQAVANAYPPSRMSEGKLLVARCARDIYLAEAHIDYLRVELEKCALELSRVSVDAEAAQRERQGYLDRARELRERLRTALQQARQNMCFRKLWQEGWPTSVCRCTCGECSKEGRAGVWDFRMESSLAGVTALPHLTPSDALFAVYTSDGQAPREPAAAEGGVAARLKLGE